jgi:hypothetical protein
MSEWPNPCPDQGRKGPQTHSRTGWPPLWRVSFPQLFNRDWYLSKPGLTGKPLVGAAVAGGHFLGRCGGILGIPGLLFLFQVVNRPRLS